MPWRNTTIASIAFIAGAGVGATILSSRKESPVAPVAESTAPPNPERQRIESSPSIPLDEILQEPGRFQIVSAVLDVGIHPEHKVLRIDTKTGKTDTLLWVPMADGLPLIHWQDLPETESEGANRVREIRASLRR